MCLFFVFIKLALIGTSVWGSGGAGLLFGHGLYVRDGRLIGLGLGLGFTNDWLVRMSNRTGQYSNTAASGAAAAQSRPYDRID